MWYMFKGGSAWNMSLAMHIFKSGKKEFEKVIDDAVDAMNDFLEMDKKDKRKKNVRTK